MNTPENPPILVETLADSLMEMTGMFMCRYLKEHGHIGKDSALVLRRSEFANDLCTLQGSFSSDGEEYHFWLSDVLGKVEIHD